MLSGMDRSKVVAKGASPQRPAGEGREGEGRKRIGKVDPSLLSKSALRQNASDAFDEMTRVLRRLPAYRGFNAGEELHNTARDFATFDPALMHTSEALERIGTGLEEMEASRIEILKSMRDLTLLGDKLNVLNDRLKESLQGGTPHKQLPSRLG